MNDYSYSEGGDSDRNFWVRAFEMESKQLKAALERGLGLSLRLGLLGG